MTTSAQKKERQTVQSPGNELEGLSKIRNSCNHGSQPFLNVGKRPKMGCTLQSRERQSNHSGSGGFACQSDAVLKNVYCNGKTARRDACSPYMGLRGERLLPETAIRLNDLAIQTPDPAASTADLGLVARRLACLKAIWHQALYTHSTSR